MELKGRLDQNKTEVLLAAWATGNELISKPSSTYLLPYLAAACLLVCLAPSKAHSEVLVPGDGGAYVPISAGSRMVAFTDTAQQARRDAPVEKQSVSVKRSFPKAEVLALITNVGLRYSNHPALRKAGLSVTDWLGLFQANIEIESAYRVNARSHVGAIGLGQLMPGTAKYLRVNPHVPAENLDGSARYLLMMLEKFGKPSLALAAYNAGPDAVEKYGGVPPYAETRGHVRKVTHVWKKLIG